MTPEMRAWLREQIDQHVRQSTAFTARNGCRECGGDFDDVTTGCKRCADRHRNRRHEASKA